MEGNELGITSTFMIGMVYEMFLKLKTLQFYEDTPSKNCFFELFNYTAKIIIKKNERENNHIEFYSLIFIICGVLRGPVKLLRCAGLHF